MKGQHRGAWGAAVEHLRRSLGQDEHRDWRRAAWWAWQGTTPGTAPGAIPADHVFFDLWAALDYAPEGDRRHIDRLLARPAALNWAALEPLSVLRDTPVRLFHARRARAPWGRRLHDVITGVHWPSTLAAAVPLDGMVLARLVWRPQGTRLVGPAAIYPPSEAGAALRLRLRTDYQRARAHGYVANGDAFYRVHTPELHHAQRAIQAEAAPRRQLALAAGTRVAQSPVQIIGGMR